MEINQDIDFEYKFWRIQRIAWVAMVLIILAALAGVFGTGPLASATASAGSLTVDYDRFTRFSTPGEYTITLSTDSTEPSIAVSDSLIKNFRISQIIPQPKSVTRDAGQTVFVFERPQGEVLQVSIQGTYDALGLISGTIRASDDHADITHLIYP